MVYVKDRNRNIPHHVRASPSPMKDACWTTEFLHVGGSIPHRSTVYTRALLRMITLITIKISIFFISATKVSKGAQNALQDYGVGIDVVQLAQHRTDMPLTQVRFPGAARDFSLRVSFQCRLSYGVHSPRCTIVCINIRAQR